MMDWQTLNVLLAGLGALLSFVAAGLTFEQRQQAQSAVLGAAML